MLALAAAAVIAIAVHRHLLADGAYYLLVVTRQGAPITFVTTRLHVHELCEWPMLWVAARAGASWATVSWTFGAMLMLGPLLVWGAALFELGDRPALRRTWTFALGWLSVLGGLYAISEIHWAAALFLWAIAMLGRPGALGLRRAVLLVAIMLVALRAYESYALLGPLLALEAAARVRDRRSRGALEIAAMIAVIALGLWQAGIAVAEVIAPRDPHNRTGAILGPLMLPTAPTVWVLVALALWRWERLGARASHVALGVALAFAGACMRFPTLLSVRTQTDARSLELWVPLLLGALRSRGVAAIVERAFGAQGVGRWYARAAAWSPAPTAWRSTMVLAVALSLVGSWSWWRWSERTRGFVAAAEALRAPMPRELRAPFYVGWSGWSLESTTLALQLVDPRTPTPVGPITLRRAAFDPEASFRPPLPR